MPERVLGRVDNYEIASTAALGIIKQLPGLVKKYPVKEIIFCENGLSYKEIMELVKSTPDGVRNKFHASGSSSIVGSDSSTESGDYVSVSKKYSIGKPLHQRNKRLLDICMSLFFILGFPLHIFLQKRPLNFYKNVFAVLFKQKTWIGYAGSGEGLPALLKPVLTCTSLPFQLNGLPAESLHNTDEWYASSYSVLLDLKKIWRGYSYLYY